MRHPRTIDLIPANIDSLSPVDAAGLMRLTIDDLAQWERLGGCCAACKRQALVNVYHIRKNSPGGGWSNCNASCCAKDVTTGRATAS
jgi:hypothetical protein